MADTRVGTTHRQLMFYMRRIEHLPCRGEQPKTASDECHAKHMKRSPLRMGTPAEQHLLKMSRIVAQPVHPRKSTLQPARKQVARERKTVHFGKQRHQKSGKCAEGVPIALGARFIETIGEEDEHKRVDGR